jgi:hypothetical protein
MAACLYKNVFIIATGRFDKDLDLWIPSADVSWQSPNGRAFHTIKFSLESFQTKEQAERFALVAAEAWVDEQHKSI